ncbi:MAG TPA: type I-U CRISPR-associated protein Csb2 [Gaiellaceae bacterium]|nr:type I-U CRISPR-associated protein Csb2 [Gaiellaceae bacterium]
MLALAIDLLADRYHATPYGRAANEGEAEWPPSPWRLGRAIVSAWWRLPPDERVTEERLDGILRQLAAPPLFVLPRATTGHTRHYMPKPNAKSSSDTALVLDPFVRTDGSILQVVWEHVELDQADRVALSTLLELVGYVGRAEGGAVVDLVASRRDGGVVVAPFASDAERDGDVVQVLCLSDEVSVEALSASTAERRRRKLVAPPAGSWVSYVRPRTALDPPRVPRRPRRRRSVEALRFALEGAAVPPITDALRLAELYRAAVLKRADGKPPSVISALRGRFEGDVPSHGHVHAHYLPTDENGDGRLDHLTVWCPQGLGSDEIGVLDFPTLTGWAFDHPLRLFLLSTLDKEEIDRIGSGPLGSARQWISHTPFLPTRHPKRRGGAIVDGYRDQLVVELERRNLPSPIDVRPVRGGRRHWGAFRRERGQREHRPDPPALGFELSFAEPVRGPIALGRNSHFGMGLFLPAG